MKFFLEIFRFIAKVVYPRYSIKMMFKELCKIHWKAPMSEIHLKSLRTVLFCRMPSGDCFYEC